MVAKLFKDGIGKALADAAVGESPHLVKLLGVWHRQPFEQEGIEHTENGGVGTYSQRQRDDCNQACAGALAQHSQAIDQVTLKIVQEAKQVHIFCPSFLLKVLNGKANPRAAATAVRQAGLRIQLPLTGHR